MKESRTPIFLQIQRWSSFSPKTRVQIVQKTLLADRASNYKNKIVAHPAGHGYAYFDPTKQPTNNISARV
jgi:hypothetical protein